MPAKIKWSIEEDALLTDLWVNSTLPSKEIKIGNKTLRQMQTRSTQLGLKRNLEAKRLATVEFNKTKGRDLSPEVLYKIAKQYTTFQEFKSCDESAYTTALKQKLLGTYDWLLPSRIHLPETIIKIILEMAYENKTILCNDRNLIKPYELDVVVLDDLIAFEYDGVNFHDIKESIERDNLKEKLCQEKGITLIRIVEKCKKRPFENIKDVMLSHGLKVDHISEKEVLEKVVKIMRLDLDRIKTEILSKYKTLKSFRENDVTTYNLLYKIGRLDIVDSIRTKKLNNSYNHNEMNEQLSKVGSKNEFRTNFHALYIHMMKNKTKFKNQILTYKSLK
jgi:hypothetical protein